MERIESGRIFDLLLRYHAIKRMIWYNIKGQYTDISTMLLRFLNWGVLNYIWHMRRLYMLVWWDFFYM